MWLGCAAVPDVHHKPQIHNPFPQLHRVVVLPFYNQSKEPTVDGEAIALAYFHELQLIPGFEVMPVGVAKQVLQGTGIQPRTGADFQQLAQLLGVDAVIVGSVTDYSPYYPPRMALTVDWYAANPGFHPIPVGYGLPWGSADEEYIPERLKLESEFALAREQLATQTPDLPTTTPADLPHETHSNLKAISHNAGDSPEALPAVQATPSSVAPSAGSSPEATVAMAAGGLPADWPDPRGFVPQGPRAQRPISQPQQKPVMTHTRLYNGKDSEFTEKLAHYFSNQDDARFGGWQGYLQRPEDFVRFCCHLHVTETLAARGGSGKTQVIVRWPISR
jgi:hypothetical protein